MTDAGVTLCAIFRIPPEGLASFLTYEDAVLPLLAGHGGELRQRLRSEDGRTEIHVIWFPSAASIDAYRADQRRVSHSALFEASGAAAEVLSVTDVNGW